MKAIIDPTKCILCKKCSVARECPVKAVFRIADDEPAVVELRLCHGCGSVLPLVQPMLWC
ncbi:MAG: 4Fe-4S dicluster domain-containing protein [Candidatus Bathyarchaeia archaeon]